MRPSRTRLTIAARPLAAALILVALTVWLLALPTAAFASVIPVTVEELTTMSDRVVVGSVDSISAREAHPERGEPDGLIVTDASIRVESVLKGPSAAELVATTLGGKLGPVMVRIDEAATFAPGERCLLFLDGSGRVVAERQGKISITGHDVPALGQSLAAVEARILLASSSGAQGWSSLGAVIAPSTDSGSVRAAAVPSIVSISPGAQSAGTGSDITITGSGFGATKGTVSFQYDGSDRTDAAISSWNDTTIVCEVPGESSSGPVIVTTPGGTSSPGFDYVVGFAYGGEKWPGAQNGSAPKVTYRVNANCNDAGAEEAALVQAAAGLWNAVSPFGFVYGGPCATTSGAGGDDHNDVFWTGTYFGSGSRTLALNMYRYYTDSHTGAYYLTECDLVFNDSYIWGDGTVRGTYDIESVAAHELGHSLSLLDQYGSADKDKMMYGQSTSGAQKRTLSEQDIAGIHYIYGDGVNPPGTITTPTVTTIKTSTISAILNRPFYLTGAESPAETGDVIELEVRKPGTGRWSYTSARLAQLTGDSGAWWCRYTPKLRGTYYFRARFRATPDRLGSLSKTIWVRAR